MVHRHIPPNPNLAEHRWLRTETPIFSATHRALRKPAAGFAVLVKAVAISGVAHSAWLADAIHRGVVGGRDAVE